MMVEVLFVGGSEDGKLKKVNQVVPQYIFSEEPDSNIVIYKTEVFIYGNRNWYMAVHEKLTTDQAMDRIFRSYHEKVS